MTKKNQMRPYYSLKRVLKIITQEYIFAPFYYMIFLDNKRLLYDFFYYVTLCKVYTGFVNFFF